MAGDQFTFPLLDLPTPRLRVMIRWGSVHIPPARLDVIARIRPEELGISSHSPC